MINNTTYQNKPVLDRSEVGNVPLGIIARFAATSKPDPATYARRIERFRLQSVARFLLPNERVSKCFRALVPHRSFVEVFYSPARRAAYLKNLQVCGSVWMCPVCSSKITERRRAELELAIKSPLYRVLMASYTLKHDRGMSLQVVLSALTEAYRSLRSTRAFKERLDRLCAAGSVRVLEVTHGEANGWHPHIHELLFLPAGVSQNQIDLLRGDLTKMWIAALERRGFTADKAIGFHLRTTDDAVAGYVTNWGAAAELAKLPVKRAKGDNLSPLQLLALADDNYRAATLWTEYALTFKGRHQLQWSPGLRKLLALPEVEKTDEELAMDEQLKEDFLLAMITTEQWNDICFLNLRAEFINVAFAGDDVALLDWLAGHGIHLD